MVETASGLRDGSITKIQGTVFTQDLHYFRGCCSYAIKGFDFKNKEANGIKWAIWKY